jgi:CheY-like chemotaxis protein
MKKVLLCEDDDEIIELTAIILQLNGYRVSVLKKCDHEIVQRVRLLQPDLVLMDLWIPDIGGENAIMQLKNDTQTKRIPVMVFSACSKAEEVAQRVQAQGCIMKPFAVNCLEEKISGFFKRA